MPTAIRDRLNSINAVPPARLSKATGAINRTQPGIATFSDVKFLLCVDLDACGYSSCRGHFPLINSPLFLLFLPHFAQFLLQLHLLVLFLRLARCFLLSGLDLGLTEHVFDNFARM